MFIRIYTLFSPFSRKYTKTGEMADAGSGHQGGDTEFEDQDLEAVAGPDTSSGLSDTPLALDQVINGMKSMNVAWKMFRRSCGVLRCALARRVAARWRGLCWWWGAASPCPGHRATSSQGSPGSPAPPRAGRSVEPVRAN